MHNGDPHLKNVAQAAGAEETRVPQETIENFCKHAQGIVRVTTRSLAQELQLPGEAAVDTVRDVLQDDLYQDAVQVYCVPCSYQCTWTCFILFPHECGPAASVCAFFS
jgi:hypothetical protein